MSLETIDKKLHDVENMPFWKFLLFFGLTPAILSVLIIYNITPTIVQTQVHPLIKTMVLLGLTAIYLVIAGGTIAFGIGLCYILIKLRNSFYIKNGIIQGNSIATNRKFLRKLAYGLYTYIIGFIRGYNDPRFEELETKYERHHNERMENERLYLNQNSRLANDVKKIPKLEAEVEYLKQQLKSKIPEKQAYEIIDDISAKAVNLQKDLDKYQTRIDDY